MAALNSVLQPPPPFLESNSLQEWHQLYGSAPALSIVSVAKEFPGVTLVICNSHNQANTLLHDLKFFATDATDINHFQDWEVLPYDNISPHQDIISSRLKTLKNLLTIQSGILVVSIQTLLQKIAPKNYIDSHSLDFSVGQKIEFSQLLGSLEKLGYQRVQQVLEHGEYAVRGEIIDIFPMGQKRPLRLDFFDDEIETIKIFSANTQRSLSNVDTVHLLPANELPVSQRDIKIFQQNWQQKFSIQDPMQSAVYRNVSNGLLPAGIESYLPLFFKNTASLFDYLPSNTLVIHFAGLTQTAQNIIEDYRNRFKYKTGIGDSALLPPESLLIDQEELHSKLELLSQINISSFESELTLTDISNFSCKPLPNLRFNHKASEPMQALLSLLQTDSRFLFVSESIGLQEALKNMLNARGIKLETYTTFKQFINSTHQYGITTGQLNQGFSLVDAGIFLIPESFLFDIQIQKRKKRKRKIEHDKIISSLTELNLDDPIVHIDHGVGRYRGLKTLKIGEQESEYMILEYAKEDVLYVPITSLDLIHRYTGADSDTAPLHRLGSTQWQKAQNTAKRKAQDVAVELLEIYAKRKAQTRQGILNPDEQYHLFATEFPFEPTEDQQDSIDAIIKDMCSDKQMDRLICGDVGFGKTEVAMRAIFLATQNAHQVAFLVPTTLLAQQHYVTLQERFANWPVNIVLLSRFNSARETKQALDKIKSGVADIVIGTHKLLSKDVCFKSLGLLIIDEEHRFGVKQKDKFKALRAQIDILTLTATPIPRTLNLSISGIRDLSIIATAPANRVAIKTFVQEWNADLLRESILREVRRGGQVYFLHNRVESINRIARELAALLPEINLEVAHGQMPESDLENVMKDFYHHKFNVLVCTTIIESGIDIPTANTIIINNADRLGLAQLYQLRGRVGRSHHRAYAYLIVTTLNSISDNAKKRLEAIESIEELGVGFSLAVQDLEIRGAGELLGAGQSGQIHEIGFEMYNEILSQAVSDLKAGKLDSTKDTISHPIEIDLGEPALIPEDYIPDINTRLVTYKRIANAKHSDSLNDLQIELIDRFGLLPDVLTNLFSTTKLKLSLQKLKIRKLDADEEEINIELYPKPDFSLDSLIKLIQQQPQKFQFAGENKFKIIDDMPDMSKKLEVIHEWQTAIL